MSAVARRYAKALFDLAREAEALQPTMDQLERLAGMARQPEVAAMLRNPVLSAARRRELARSMAGEAGASDLLARFVGLLAEHQRLTELGPIHGVFESLLDGELGRVRIAIRTSGPLTAEAQEKILAAFAKRTGKQVIPRVVVDPELLGGVVVEAEGKVYDGSVRTQLQRLANELAAGASL